MTTRIVRLLTITAGLVLAGGCASTPVSIVVGPVWTDAKFKEAGTTFEGSIDTRDAGFGIFGEFDPGRRERVIFRAGYERFGDVTFDGLYEGVDDVGSIESESFTATLAYRYPFTDRFSAGYNVGVAVTDVSESEVFGGVPEGSSASDTVPFGGLGMKFAVTDRVSISANYNRYLDVGKEDQTGESDVDAFSLNFHYRFGARNDD